MDSLTARKFRPPLGDATGSSIRKLSRSGPPPYATRWRGAEGSRRRYKGITAPGGAAPTGLFPIVKTGISVQPVIDAALAFATLLTPEQRKARASASTASSGAPGTTCIRSFSATVCCCATSTSRNAKQP